MSTLFPQSLIKKLQETLTRYPQTSIVLDRNGTELDAQNVVIYPLVTSEQVSEATRAATGSVRITGQPDLDVALGDTFALNDTLYRVFSILDDKSVFCMADCEVAQ